MIIKVSIPLVFDSFNSYPEETLDIVIGEVHSGFKTSDSDRVVEVSNEELKRVLSLIP